jgi:hypothetical protein
LYYYFLVIFFIIFLLPAYFLSLKYLLIILEPDDFVFLSIFKWERRKGWDVLINAFLEEFRLDEPVSLVILTHPFDASDPIKAYSELAYCFLLFSFVVY